MSLAHTKPSSQKIVVRPPPSRSSQTKATHGKATHSVPAALDNGADALTASHARQTKTAPAIAIEIAHDAGSNVAMITVAAAVPMIVVEASDLAAPDMHAHSQAMPTAASSTKSVNHGGPNQTAASANGPITDAEMIRSLRLLERGGTRLGPAEGDGVKSKSARTGRRAETAFAAVEIADGLFEIGLAEIRPQRIDENEFGISALPQQEVADAQFAAGTDQ